MVGEAESSNRVNHVSRAAWRKTAEGHQSLTGCILLYLPLLSEDNQSYNPTLIPSRLNESQDHREC